jgi:hypothetical protein
VYTCSVSYVATEAELAPPGLLAYLGGLYMSGTVSASVLADITDHVCAAGTDGLLALEQIRVSDASKNGARTFKRILGFAAEHENLYKVGVPLKQEDINGAVLVFEFTKVLLCRLPNMPYPSEAVNGVCHVRCGCIRSNCNVCPLAYTYSRPPGPTRTNARA